MTLAGQINTAGRTVSDTGFVWPDRGGLVTRDVIAVLDDGRKLRFHLNRDAYDNQTYVVAHVWVDGWQQIIRRDGTEVELPSAYLPLHKRDEARATFDLRMAEVFEVALEVTA